MIKFVLEFVTLLGLWATILFFGSFVL